MSTTLKLQTPAQASHSLSSVPAPLSLPQHITPSLKIEVDAAQFLDSDHLINSKSAGRWTPEEHMLFLQGLDRYNKQWKQIAELVKTRTVVQIRTHAQKYFQKLSKCRSKSGDLDEFTASTDEYDATFSFPSGCDSRKNSISLPDHSPLHSGSSSSMHSFHSSSSYNNSSSCYDNINNGSSSSFNSSSYNSADNTTFASNATTSSEGESDAERATASDLQFATSPGDLLASKFPGTLEATLRQRQNLLRVQKSDLVRKRTRDSMKSGGNGGSCESSNNNGQDNASSAAGFLSLNSSGSGGSRSPKKSNTNPNSPAMSPQAPCAAAATATAAAAATTMLPSAASVLSANSPATVLHQQQSHICGIAMTHSNSSFVDSIAAKSGNVLAFPAAVASSSCGGSSSAVTAISSTTTAATQASFSSVAPPTAETMDISFIHMLDKIDWLGDVADNGLAATGDQEMYDSRANSPFTDSASTVSTCTGIHSQHLSAHDLLHLAQAHSAMISTGRKSGTSTGGPSTSVSAAAPSVVATASSGGSEQQQETKTRETRVRFSNVISELKLVTEVARNGSNESDHISLFNLCQQQKCFSADGTEAGKLPSMKTLVRTLANSQLQRSNAFKASCNMSSCSVSSSGTAKSSDSYSSSAAPSVPLIITDVNQNGLDLEFSKFILEDCNFLNCSDDFRVDAPVSAGDHIDGMMDVEGHSISYPETSIATDVAAAASFLPYSGTTAAVEKNQKGEAMATSPGGSELYVQDTNALVTGETLLQNPKQLSVLHSIPMSVRASDAAAAALAAAAAAAAATAQTESAPRKRGRPRKHPLPAANSSSSIAALSVTVGLSSSNRFCGSINGSSSSGLALERQWKNMNSIQPHVLRNSTRFPAMISSTFSATTSATIDNSSPLAQSQSSCATPAAEVSDPFAASAPVVPTAATATAVTAPSTTAAGLETDAFDLLYETLDSEMLEDFE